MNQKKYKAFSMIELSLVLLIIGILIAGITTGSRMVAEFNLTAARTMTQSSPTSSIKGLILWLDATSQDSFAETEAEDGSQISAWNDINPQSYSKIILAQSVSGNQPIYKRSAINKLPAIKFDGIDDFLSNSDFYGIDKQATATVFFVIKTPDNFTSDSPINSPQAIFTKRSDTSGLIGNLAAGISEVPAGESWYIMMEYGEFDSNAAEGPVKTEDNYIMSMTMSTDPDIDIDTGKTKFYENGREIYSSSRGYRRNKVSQDGDLFIGTMKESGGSNIRHFSGHLGELIIFNKALNSQDRHFVENYLSKKWNIDISRESS